MKKFMDRDFLLETETARKLYHQYAADMPILDYHCHIDPREIYEDRHFENITQLWLGADHYKWRLMRWAGIEERFITGDAPDWEKFEKWAQALEGAIGNPLYHWCHLELQRYFGYEGVLNTKSAGAVWELCNAALQRDEFSARNLIRRSRVTLLCTTDDPADSLEWHKKLAEDQSFEVTVLPAWRPDKAVGIGKEDYLSYLARLEEAAGMKIDCFGAFLLALAKRMDFFASMGCRISDHGLPYVMYAPADVTEVDRIFRGRLEGRMPSPAEEAKFTCACMMALGREYHRRNWAMQLHYGVKRDNNQRLFGAVGADAGVDCIDNYTPSSQLADFLNALDVTGQLPKTIVYSLNPVDNAAIGSVIGCFQDAVCAGKVQQGSAWWFNDHKSGMEEQMRTLAAAGSLGTFIGMLTDSRSFLSYVRHEYFRRILCNLLGSYVENGEYPDDEETLGRIVKGICYHNGMAYFGFAE
ncbi:MAG: glucuronate isomerase [Bacteroidales bacterium]|nr:glucuronate isomerase [Bacteroidales bacterium]MCM1415922.1 glucuronate isomerase [bacterium]MCM1422658.1 glucuronate isomerase [bacterium]